MSEQRNFIITIISVTLVLILSVLYVLVNVVPNIYWMVGLIVLVGLSVAFIFSIIFFSFAKLKSFETPREMYRRQIKKATIVGLLAISLLLAQKFFDLL